MPGRNHHTKNRKKWLRWLILFGVVLLLVAAGRLVLKSDWLFNRVRGIAEAQVNSRLNGALEIGSIRGDLLSGFMIRDVHLTGPQNENIASVDSISVSYGFWSFIRTPHQIDEVHIWGADLFVRQDADSVWNVMKLLDTDTGITTPEEENILFGSVETLRLDRLNIHIESEYLLPDGFVTVNDLNADLTAGIEEAGFFGSARELAFTLAEARLPELIDVLLAGEARNSRITLEKLIAGTGRTLLRSSGEYSQNGELRAEADLAPVSWQDLSAYLKELPLRQDVRVELGVRGRLDALAISLSASAPGLETFEGELEMGIDDSIVLRSLKAEARNLDTQTLFPGMETETGWPRAGSILLTGAGEFFTGEPGQSVWSGDLTITGFSMGDYLLDTFTAGYELDRDQAEISATAGLRGEQIKLKASAGRIMGENPFWEAGVTARELNLAVWLGDPDLDCVLNIDGFTEGTGMTSEQLNADIRLQVSGNRYGNQSFSRIGFEGTVSPGRIAGILQGKLDQSELRADFDIQDWQAATPVYRFEAFVNRFDVSELTGMENFPTSLNGSLTGSGSSFDAENLKLQASARFDSSLVNRESLDTFRADFLIENQILTTENAVLESGIADAGLSARQHITDTGNPGNRLDFHALIKDLQSLAPLAGLERLRATGSITGSLTRNQEEVPEFSGELDLEDAAADSLFSSERILGSAAVRFYDEPEVNLNAGLIRPVVNGINLQDFQARAAARIMEEGTVNGDIGFVVSGDENSMLRHQGTFRADSSSFVLKTDSLEFSTSLRTLSVVRPFEASYTQNTLKVDSLTLRTPDGQDAFLTFWAPHIDSLRQTAGLTAQNLNLGAIQKTLISEDIFDGLLSGSLFLNNTPDSLEVSATGLLSGIRYQSGEMDSLRFNAQLKDEWLDGELYAWHNGRELLDGAARVPHLPGDPLTFDEQFFDRDVSGRLRMEGTDLSYWFSFLPENEEAETGGVLSFDAALSGIAGNPELEGTLSVREGVFSGIALDSVGMDLSYLHQNGSIDLRGDVFGEGQRVLDFEANLPFLVDFKAGNVLFPSDGDSVFLHLRTDDFNLRLFSNYADREQVRQLGGTLDGEVTLTGPMGALRSDGYMELTDGTMRIVPAGITLDRMSSRIQFDSDGINLEQFSVRSGPGRIRASGFVGLNDLTPGQIQLDVRAEQFRAANTSEYNATVNMNAAIRGTLEEPRLAGSLTFLNGFVNLQNFGETSVEDVRLEDEEEVEPNEFYESLAVDMSVNFNRQFFIRNRQFLDMEIELGGEVDLLKDPRDELQMFGSLEGVRGYARPLGKNFELDEAVVSFFGPVDNPELNITTRYEPPQAQSGVRIFYIIEGTVQEPEFRFDSEPYLELQDIISYTVFGKPFYELESWEQVVAGSGNSPTAADLAIDVLLDRVEMIASQRLGIDVVQIDNSRSGSTSTTSIKTGWYLNQRTFFAILNEISSTRPKTLFMLEYLLRENLELLLTQGDDSREGIDLRWEYNY